MRRLNLSRLPPAARAAILAGASLVLVLAGIWAFRSIVQLPAFLPNIGEDGGIWEQIGRVMLGLSIVALAFGTPLYFLFLRNGQLAAAKKAIHAREAEFRAYAEAGSDWLWATDSHCRITSLVGGDSEEFESARQRILGKTLDQAIGSSEVIADAGKWRQFHEDIRARRPFRNFELKIHDSRSKDRHLSLSAIPTFDDTGAFIGYRGVTTDITEQKAAAIALRRSEQRFADFASSASDWFWETDQDHRFVFNSDRIGDTLGVPPTHALRQTRFDLASEAHRARHADAWRQHRDDLDHHRPFRNLEYEIIVNGERRTIVTSGVPVFDGDGQFTGYRGSAADVTDYRRTEREALEYMRQFRLLADNLPIMIANFDADWRFIYVNHTAEIWFDRPRDEIIGRTFEEVAGHDLQAASVPARQRVVAGETVSLEFATTFPDGKTRTVQRTLVPDLQPGEAPRFHVMAIDVTDQRQLEEQVRQHLKMEALGNLTGGVAHDFNNLLLAIQGNLEFLRDEPLDPTLQPFVVNALRGVDRAADLTRRLLAFSRRQPLTPRAVNVVRLVEEMEPLLRRTLEAYVDLTIDAGNDPAVALIDPGQLENAILNLAINARDAMPDGGSVSVRVRQSAVVPPADDDRVSPAPDPTPYVCIEVQDDGAGMPDGVRDHAFEPFFTTKEVGHGTGLGLAMVHGFVVQSGGFAEIDTTLGSGTIVRLFLPTAAAAEDKPAAPRPEMTEIPGAGTALLVEENEMVRAVTERHLSDLGYEVVAVAAPLDAEAVFDGPRVVDLVVTNLTVGDGRKGFDVAERARLRWPAAGIVVMTGHSDLADNRGRADRVNAQLIAKPFSRTELAEAIMATQSPHETPDSARPLRAAS